MNQQTTDLVNDLMGGVHDDRLDAIIEAANARRKTLARITASQLKVGDRVELTDIRPKYLSGAIGVIASKNGKGLRVTLENEALKIKAGRYIGPDGTVGVPEGCVTPLEQ